MPKGRNLNRKIEDDAIAQRATRHVRYIVMPVTGHKNVIKYQAFDSKTDTFVGWQYTDEIFAQEKCNELNRLKAPH